MPLWSRRWLRMPPCLLIAALASGYASGQGQAPDRSIDEAVDQLCHSKDPLDAPKCTALVRLAKDHGQAPAKRREMADELLKQATDAYKEHLLTAGNGLIERAAQFDPHASLPDLDGLKKSVRSTFTSQWITAHAAVR